MTDYSIKELKEIMQIEYKQLQREHLKSLKKLQEQIRETEKHLKRVIIMTENLNKGEK